MSQRYLNSMSKDYYNILGVPRKATKSEIKQAFRKLAHKYHPDKKGGDETKFKEVSEAYTVLSDDKKRAEFDSYGRVFSDGGGAGGAGFQGFDFSGQDFQGFDFGDIFNEFFGRGRDRVKRGRDISIDLEISFKESIFGVDRKVLLMKTSKCSSCKGSGAKEGTDLDSCKICNGKGKIHETKSSLLGTFSSVRSCETCRGTGSVPKEKCTKCYGLGITKQQEEISIIIPSGINNGEMIRLTGAGEAVVDGISGDLYIKIHVKPDPIFKKEGTNITMTLNIKLSDALLGKTYNISTLDGDVSVKIPAGVSFNEILRLKGKGVPITKNNNGDLLIRVNIKLPSKLSKKSKKVIESLREEGI